MKDAIRYTVRVFAITESTEKIGKEWAKVGEEPITTADGVAMMKGVWGYTPPVDKTVRRELLVFEQTVDAPVDMPSLVAVVNGVRPWPATGA